MLYLNKTGMKKIISLIVLLCLSAAAYAQYNVVDNRKLKYGKNGNFKIVQFTDIHYQPENTESQRAISMMQEVLEAEKPDLVVITGDLAWAAPAERAFDEVLDVMIQAETPWTVTFGNHDDEHGLSRPQIMEHIINKPYGMCLHGADNVKGTGNYTLELLDPNNDSVKTVLYLMDSRSYTPIAGVGDYGWFDLSQVNWYANTANAYKEQNNGNPVPALSFFHIPLCEYELMAAQGEDAYIGTRQEPECNGKLNTGMFGAMKEAGDMMGVFVGHDHNNDYIGVYHGIALAYGRFSGGNTVYNDLGENGCRVIELQQNKPGFSTYIRLKGGEKLHRVKYPETFVKEK